MNSKEICSDYKILQDSRDCTGCAACLNICNFGAISMNRDAEGFLYPEIDKDKCTNCGICRKICPIINPNFDNTETPDCIAAWANDEIRKSSSSGGIFTLLAEYILANNGYVCGAAFDENWKLKHCIISNKSELNKLQGSKYVQSEINIVYKEIKSLIEEDKTVLFSGTPCQIGGLKAFLQKDYTNLITVDVVCHGAPSPIVFNKYIKEFVGEEPIEDINFRDKAKGWATPILTTKTYSNSYSFPSKEDLFFRAFLSNMCLRPACTHCSYSNIPRQGDITLGDFWGISKYDKKLDDNKGTSLVLLNNDKGLSIFNKIGQNLKLKKEVPLDVAIKGNPCLVRPAKKHPNRDIFFELIKTNLPFKEVIDQTTYNPKNVGILNFWWGAGINYGAMLTAYALQEVVKSLGYNPQIVNYILRKKYKKYANSIAEKFARKYLNLTKYCCKKSKLKKLNKEIETFIVGSDQVWRHSYNAGFKGTFYLNFADESKKKIACAASFGLDHFEGNFLTRFFTKRLIKKFDAVSVREKDGVNICKKTFDVDAEHILDPVFMLEPEAWNELINNAQNKDNDSITHYILDKTPEKMDALEYTSSSLKAPLFDIKAGVSTEEWLCAIKNCKFFVTDSFHGVCFSIIFNKPFICIANKDRGFSRFESILSLLNLKHRLVFNPSEIKNKEHLLKNIDYSDINSKLKEEKDKSLSWLKQSLELKKQLNN